MVYSLLKHRDLPKSRANMGDADLIRLWIAVAAIPCIANLHEHMSAKVGLSPTGRMHGLEMQNEVTLARECHTTGLTGLCESQAGHWRLQKSSHVAIHNGLSDVVRQG